jgi:hypothetical protein
MRRLIVIVGLVALTATAATAAPSARSVSPAQLTNAGWSCFNGPRPFNPNVHCAPPGVLDRVLTGEAETAALLTFATEDTGAAEAVFLGTERLIRADLFHGQPCPTDPPTYEYGYLGPLLGLDYYVCHTFDSPW